MSKKKDLTKLLREDHDGMFVRFNGCSTTTGGYVVEKFDLTQLRVLINETGGIYFLRILFDDTDGRYHVWVHEAGDDFMLRLPDLAEYQPEQLYSRACEQFLSLLAVRDSRTLK